MAEYKLWKVTIRYDAHHIDGTDTHKSEYRVPGINQEEALQKARNLFSEKKWKGKELVEGGQYWSAEVTLNNYRERIEEDLRAVPVPKISGPDAEKFKLTPRISVDGKNIEYVVSEILKE